MTKQNKKREYWGCLVGGLSHLDAPVNRIQGYCCDSRPCKYRTVSSKHRRICNYTELRRPDARMGCFIK